MFENQHLNLLEKCLELAYQAVGRGNHPFGALLEKEGKILLTSENEVGTREDLTAHAELRLIQKAQKILSLEELRKCRLYSSTEPCAMCTGAIYWCGIKEVVYGCSTLQLSQAVGGTLEARCEAILKQGLRKVQVYNFSFEEKFKIIHQKFWNKKEKR
ncbi:MAG: nucleoside deaminase [Halobacteriovoraceae bacterium]|nr:nucleoside deaminase [Halobacteriovoraceae bacterium]MCB9095270.1 nucleoside deaminase [Halobacteriovoraceae bacterium]